MNIKRMMTRALKKDSIVAYEKMLEKLAKDKNSYWFRYYYDFRSMSEKSKWYHYYSMVVRRTDFKPKYKAKALDYLCKR